jgi:hypothetical protein
MHSMYNNIKFKFKSFFLRIFTYLRSDYMCFFREFSPLLNTKDLNIFLSSFPFRSRYRISHVEVPISSEILVIAPHPDDEVFGCGGAILNMVDSGCSVSIIYVTTGSVKYKESIKKEALCVTKDINCNAIFLDNNPSKIPLSAAKDIQNIVNKLEPKYIFTPFFLDDNDDHKRINELLLPLGAIKSNIVVWAYQVYSILPLNAVVDITNIIEKKMSLCGQYKHVSGNRDWPHYVKGLNAVMSRFIPGKKSLYGESFFIANLDDYIDLVDKYFFQNRENCYLVEEYIENKVDKKCTK